MWRYRGDDCFLDFGDGVGDTDGVEVPNEKLDSGDREEGVENLELEFVAIGVILKFDGLLKYGLGKPTVPHWGSHCRREG